MSKHVGRFLISDKLIHENPEIAQKVLSKVIVVRCEHIAYKFCFEYYAYSKRFDVLQEGQEVPLYDIYIKNGFVSFKRVE